jgi:cyclopropane-fatty-acyl-phospholipid synthase
VLVRGHSPAARGALLTGRSERGGKTMDVGERGRVGAAALSVLDSIGSRSRRGFDVEMPNGERHRVGPGGEAAFRLVLRDTTPLLATLARGHIGLLEAYLDGSIDVEGDFRAVFQVAAESGFDSTPHAVNRLENEWLEVRHANRDPATAKANARAHYGLGTPFFSRWLDEPLMMYTCAYWPEGTTTLEEAQRNKIDHVCRKIRLSPGERYVDIGCGFGGFMLRALETRGALGTGVNTTTEQVDWLREQIARQGLADRLAVREADFREVDAEYDKVVSIGVLEHAGRDQLPEVIRAHADFLKTGGIGMLHFIGHLGPHETELFIRKHVFPGGWIPALSDVLEEMERCGLEVIDIENLRRHYAPTLDAWAERFDRCWVEIQALDPKRFDEKFRRIWRTYLVGCAEMFRSPFGYTHLFQIVFSKGNVTHASYPMSRAHLYA